MSKKDNKPKVTTYAVDAFYTLAHCFMVEATSREEAEEKVQGIIQEKLFNAIPAQAGHIAAEMGFEDCDDVEIIVSGELDPESGEMEYF